MKAKHISDVNEAILVLRHFIDLSAKLLPFLEELEQIPAPSHNDLLSRQKIIEVYQNYEFDTSTSRVLMNSNILDLIKETFLSIQNHSCRCPRNGISTTLRRFLLEHKRLRENWDRIEAN